MISLTYTFLASHSDFSLNELIWGYQRGLITLEDALSLGLQFPICKAGFDIAFSSEDEARCALESKLLETSAKKHKIDDDAAKNKWLKLALLDQYERRHETADPLEEVARIYADFDYPEGIVEFLHYMPSRGGYDPSEHSKEENIERLMDKWKVFLGDLLR